MASDRQTATNRANARKSTGPKSDAGKAVARLNAERGWLANDLCAALGKAGVMRLIPASVLAELRRPPTP